jgi:uncharacterized membrane protein YphA (DoxX/SURF4 family)
MTHERPEHDAVQPPPAAPRRRSAGTVALLWVAKLLAAGILGYAAFLKLLGHQGEIDLFTQLGWEPHGRYLIGGLEILAALMIIVPQSAIYGAFLGLGIMLGAMIGHLTAFQLDGIQFALLVATACVTVLYIRRHDAEFIRNLWDR